MAKLGLASLKLKWSIRLPPEKWKHGINRGPACNDIALTSLTALRDSADVFPPLQSVVGGVLALWDAAEVPPPLQRAKTSKERARALSRRAYEVLEVLTDAVPDPSNIHPSMLVSIQRFDDVLREARDAIDPLTKRRRFVSSVLSVNRDEATLELFNRRLDESFQTFTIGGLTRVETQLLAIKADATATRQDAIVAHQALIDTLNSRLKYLDSRFKLILNSVGLICRLWSLSGSKETIVIGVVSNFPSHYFFLWQKESAAARNLCAVESFAPLDVGSEFSIMQHTPKIRSCKKIRRHSASQQTYTYHTFFAICLIAFGVDAVATVDTVHHCRAARSDIAAACSAIAAADAQPQHVPSPVYLISESGGGFQCAPERRPLMRML
ncbi:hypothetical protein GGX14DRAFT_391853 [Mycena pura]|uniref:Uncharacterized protein n=1 Tax=Mycena pura TaxID=153505 RepID=A0AAD6VK70_9AGAR|nr:hypothetical protein GGX14DRAFT_391853 [Mycena pura]